MWKRLIVVDGDAFQVFKMNGGMLYVVGVDMIDAISGMRFDEAEWASTKFDTHLTRIKDGEEIESNPRRFLTVYVDDMYRTETVLNEGLKLDNWARANLIMELEALIDELRARR